MQGICTVCKLLNSDTSIKEVGECKKCDAFFCLPCSRNPIRRAKAMALRVVRGKKA